jgi:carbon monoxide dehydrogenase subunit G
MHLEKQFDVKTSRTDAAAVLTEDATLVDLFPDQETQIVARKGNRRTTRTRYRALGREGTATFHFDTDEDGSVHFEKVCDGRVWRELTGSVTLEARGQATRVTIEMEGRTKMLVPEFAIRGEMQDQIEQMASALRKKLAAAAKAAKDKTSPGSAA